MAITTRRNKKGVSYRVWIRGSDGVPITKTFKAQADAKRFETHLLAQIHKGRSVSNEVNRLTVDGFFASSFEETHSKTCEGWKKSKLLMYQKYVSPFIGQMKLTAVRGQHINKVLTSMAKDGLSPQMSLHVFNLLRKLFNDAVEDYDYLAHSPVKRKHKPIVPEKETPHLSVDQARKLLTYVKGKSYEVAIWLEVLLGDADRRMIMVSLE